MKKIYLIPNLVTTANMLCGYASIIQSIEGEFVMASWLILLAAFFDTLDGRIARLAKATSSFGVEYDSLSDLVSFGLAPALLLYKFDLINYGRAGLLISFLYAGAAALRLARFNVTTQSLPKSYFQGVASPVAAGAIATYQIFTQVTGLQVPYIAWIQAIALGGLMVSSLPFPSFKEVNWRARSSRGYVIVGAMCVVAIALKPEISLFIINTSYVLLSLSWIAWKRLMKKQTPTQLPLT